MAKHYKCARCKKAFPDSQIEVHHIVPVIDPDVGFVDWNTYIERLYVEKDLLEVVCKACHKKL